MYLNLIASPRTSLEILNIFIKAHLPQPPVAAVKPLGVQAIVAGEASFNRRHIYQ